MKAKPQAIVQLQAIDLLFPDNSDPCVSQKGNPEVCVTPRTPQKQI